MLLFLQLMPTLSRIDYVVVLHGVIQPDKQCPAAHASNACISYFVMSRIHGGLYAASRLRKTNSTNAVMFQLFPAVQSLRLYKAAFD